MRALALCAGALFLSPTLFAQGYGKVSAVLARRGPDDTRSSDELVRGLATLGEAAVPQLYSLSTGAALDDLVGEDWRAEDWLCRPEDVPELCRAALGLVPTAAVVAHLEGVLDGRPEVLERISILRVLATQQHAAVLPVLLRDAEGLGDLELNRPRIQRALREALLSILRADPEVWDLLTPPSVEKLLPAAREALLQAIGQCGRPRGMDLLESLRGRRDAEVALLIDAMATLEGERPWSLSGRTMRAARLLWRSQDPEERGLAARTAGRLHALEALPELLESLEDPEASVRRCAESALATMAGRAVGEGIEAWEPWLEREEAWHEERFGTLLETVASVRPGPAVAALRELGLHPLYRHEAARALASGLEQDVPQVAVAVCGWLGESGSLTALPGLVATLSGRNPQRKAAAWHALRKLTGEEAGLAPELWRRRVDL